MLPLHHCPVEPRIVPTHRRDSDRSADIKRIFCEHCDLLVRLPMAGTMPSLNVSNAAAVALYELNRKNLA